MDDPLLELFLVIWLFQQDETHIDTTKQKKTH